jgi:hypothetical protein
MTDTLDGSSRTCIVCGQRCQPGPLGSYCYCSPVCRVRLEPGRLEYFWFWSIFG